MNRNLVLLMIMICSFFIMISCSNDQEVTTEEDQQDTEIDEQVKSDDVSLDNEEDQEEEPKEQFTNVFPLTGLGTNDNIDYRPIGVMIENSKSARPQSGIHQADVVYEVLSEGTITRLLAFFHSEKPEIIGPVRSSRDYYIRLNNGYEGIYVSAGGSPGAFAMIQSGQVDHISGLSYDGRYFYRSKERRAPHNLYSSYEDILKAVDNSGHSLETDLPALPFVEEDSVGATDLSAKRVEINYGSTVNSVSYEYNQDLNSYIRYNGGEQTVDHESKTPVQLKNLFIVEASHRIIDDAGRRDVDIKSGGKAYLIQKGTAKEVKWENRDGRIIPIENGEPLGFIPGKTWINVIPTSPGIEEGVTFIE